MTLAENDIATRLRQIANKEDFDNTVAWIDSYPTIEWTTNDAEPDIIKALVLNIIFTGNSQDQKCLLAVLLKKKLVLDSDKIKSYLKKGCRKELLQMCVERYNQVNSEDGKAELTQNGKSLSIEFTRVITVGTQEALKFDGTQSEQ